MTDPKATLAKLNQNLNILQEREARYGGNAPIELVNQIEDHRQAIDLTRQAITGELSGAEWREALKPLLLACRDGRVVNIRAETYVAGDQIITNIYEAPPPPLPPAEAKERHDLTILLNKVKAFWIEGVLEKSVHNIALIDLGKETQAEAVAHAWEQVLELPDQSRQTLPPDKKISQIFDEMNRVLLILGTPGSGKTITLLQLARDLIAQAEHEESYAQPVPVVFNLSTWRRGQPLIDWLVAELSAKYQIPKRIGRPWLENNRLLPLLDGLDEVQEEERAACVEAINQFGAEYGLSGLVVCSRVEEYVTLPVRLKLNGAIRLQPLTLEQVYDYLEAAGSKLEALRVALETDDGLQALAQTPLALGIMTLAYQNMPPEALAGQAAESLETRRQHLLDTYIERMFQRKGLGRKRYPEDQTKAWLSWLANGMIRHNQGIFLIEQLQPSWLSSRIWVWIYVLGSRMSIGLISGLMVGLLMGVSEIWLKTRTELLVSGLGSWLMFGLMWGLIIGLVLVLIDRIRLERSRQRVAQKENSFHPQQVFHVLVIWLIFGAVNGLLFGIVAGPLFGVAAVFLFGVAGTVFAWLRGIHQSLTSDIQTVEALSWSWRKARKLAPFGLIVGIVYGLATASIFFADQEFVHTVMKDAPVFNLMGQKGFLLSEGIFWGLFGVAAAAMMGGLNSQVEASKTIPNQGIRLTLRNALLIGLGFGPLIGLLAGLLNGLFYGSWWNALSTGLAFFIGIGTIAFGIWGGVDIIQHYTLRVILWYRGYTPFIYFRFLNYAAERIFLQRVGGGYIFIHRLLLEHFAAMGGTADGAE